MPREHEIASTKKAVLPTDLVLLHNVSIILKCINYHYEDLDEIKP